MENAQNISETTRRLSKSQKLILQLLYTSPHPIKKFNSVKDTILNLQAKSLIELKAEQVSVTSLGQAIYESWQEKDSGVSDSPSEPQNGERKQLSKSDKIRQRKLEKSNQFLELYKQGLSYQNIGDKYGLSRERVRQILNINPAFSNYMKERDEAKAAAELAKEEQALLGVYGDLPVSVPTVIIGTVPLNTLSLNEIREIDPCEYREIKDAVFARCTDAKGFITCAVSKFRSQMRRDFQIDHTKPMSEGGLTTIENLQVLSRKAHTEKTRFENLKR